MATTAIASTPQKVETALDKAVAVLEKFSGSVLANIERQGDGIANLRRSVDEKNLADKKVSTYSQATFDALSSGSQRLMSAGNDIVNGIMTFCSQNNIAYDGTPLVSDTDDNLGATERVRTVTLGALDNIQGEFSRGEILEVNVPDKLGKVRLHSDELLVALDKNLLFIRTFARAVVEKSFAAIEQAAGEPRLWKEEVGNSIEQFKGILNTAIENPAFLNDQTVGTWVLQFRSAIESN